MDLAGTASSRFIGAIGFSGGMSMELDTALEYAVIPAWEDLMKVPHKEGS
jgi:ribosomal protein S5